MSAFAVSCAGRPGHDRRGVENCRSFGRAWPSGCLRALRRSAPPSAASVALETEDSDLRSPDFNTVGCIYSSADRAAGSCDPTASGRVGCRIPVAGSKVAEVQVPPPLDRAPGFFPRRVIERRSVKLSCGACGPMASVCFRSLARSRAPSAEGAARQGLHFAPSLYEAFPGIRDADISLARQYLMKGWNLQYICRHRN
jgi:hypothetical protein